MDLIEEQCDDDSVCTSEKMNDLPERRAGSRSLLEVTLLGVSLVAGNHFHYWNAGLPDGTIDFLVATIVGGASYLCLLLCLAEMTSALPFGGGLYGMARVLMGPYVGFITACCEMLQSIVFTASLIYPAGRDLAILFGLSQWYAFPFWVLLLVLALLVNVVEVKYFWRINVILVGVVVILFCIYYAVSMPCMDCMRYGGGVLEGKPEKTVPRSFLWAFGIAAFSAMLLIITVGCNAPGVAYMANLKTNALVYGYAKGLHIDPRVARVLSIPGSFATASAFTYVYGNQLRSMAQSGLLPTVLCHCYGPDQIPYVALILGAGLVLVCVSIFFAVDTNILLEMLVFGHLAAARIQPALWNLRVGYFCRVRHSQKFSLQEQEVMFQAYVINDAMSVAMSANLSRRTKKRHNVHTTTSLNTPTASPSPSKSHMLKESKALLSRVSACLPRMPRLQTGWYSVERLRRAGNLSTDNLKREKVVYPDEYSSAVKGETRLFQLQGGKGEEEATTPDLGKNSLFSLSLEVVECGVRKHPASEYDNKGQYNGSTKYRIAPDYVTTEQFPSSMKNIFSDEGIVVESSGKASVDDA
eukprot:scaffold859_cov234-Ochromonas_danica.AAC.4